MFVQEEGRGNRQEALYVKIIQSEKQKGKRVKESEQSLGNQFVTIKGSCIYTVGVPKNEGKEQKEYLKN